MDVIRAPRGGELNPPWIKNWVKRKQHYCAKNHLTIISSYPESELKKKLEKRHALAGFIVEFLYSRSSLNLPQDDAKKEFVMVEFSVYELKKQYERQNTLFKANITPEDVEDALFQRALFGKLLRKSGTGILS